MNRTTRRRFIKTTAGALAALGSLPLSALSKDGASSEASVHRSVIPDAAAVKKFASRISGIVVAPESEDYERARLVFNRAFDRRPALIVYCTTQTDVSRTVEFARRQQFPLAVRSGGHNRAGLSVCDEGLVLDLSKMNRVDVDAHRQLARADGGALVINLDAATQRLGLATTSGGCPTVGIAGLTLGGGEGFLMSKYGAACDNLISARLVTADGAHVEASPASNPDLFWAIRGGGGNFGIATSLEYRLYPVGEVLAGTLLFEPGRIPEFLQAFAKFVAAAPDEMNVVGQVVGSKDGPMFQMIVGHCGDPRTGNELLSAWRSLNPRRDTVGLMPYLQANATINPAAPAAHFQTNLFLPDLSAAAIETISRALTQAPPNTRVFMVPFYGAVTRVSPNETAFPLRSFGYEVDIMGRFSDSADAPRAIQWVKALRDELKPFAAGLYVNQLGETSDALVQAAYGEKYARLAAIKQKYDPQNVLRSNQNIAPA